MAQLQVIVNKLNKRKSPVLDFADKSNVVEVLSKDAVFESVGEITNLLGKWHLDGDGYYHWDGGVKPRQVATKTLELTGKQTFQWFDDLNIAEIWNKYNEKGSLVTIAVLDTGFTKENLDVEKGVVEQGVIIDLDNYSEEQLVIDDKSIIGHGTRCASLIGSRNELKSIIGIAPECKLIIGKISINREVRKFEYILNGIQWAINNGADIISISYAVELSQEEADRHNIKFEKLLQNNSILIFAAAGNSDGTVMSGERYPASFANCISVGATDKNKVISNFTISSTKTILHAQGTDIESYGKNSFPDPQSGTSYSTPIVAAIAGLAVSYSKRKGAKIIRSEFLNKVISTAEDIKDRANKKIVNIENLFSQI